MNPIAKLTATAALAATVVGAPTRARAEMVKPSADTGCYSQPTSPQWAVSSRGDPTDVVQFYLHGPLALIQGVFAQEGWTQALPENLPDDVVYGEAVALGINWVIQRMPMSMEDLCGSPMVDGWEKDNHPLAGRQHFRIFDAGLDNAGRRVWAISASLDTAIRFDPHRPNQFFINHASEADEDLERDRVLEVLENADAIASMHTLNLAPTGYAQDNGAYSADGKVYDIVIH